MTHSPGCVMVTVGDALNTGRWSSPRAFGSVATSVPHSQAAGAVTAKLAALTCGVMRDSSEPSDAPSTSRFQAAQPSHSPCA